MVFEGISVKKEPQSARESHTPTDQEAESQVTTADSAHGFLALIALLRLGTTTTSRNDPYSDAGNQQHEQVCQAVVRHSLRLEREIYGPATIVTRRWKGSGYQRNPWGR